jgi:hypothetical protein
MQRTFLQQRLILRTFKPRTDWKIFAVVMVMSLAAHGQSVGAQSPSVQSVSAQPSAGQASVGASSAAQPSSTQASSGQSAAGQSLGDIARQLREKQGSQQAATTPGKVITNQDLGEGPEGRPDLRVERRAADYDRRAGLQPGQQRAGDPRAEQWKGRILEQKDRVASLQARIDQINASLHSGAQMEYNRNQSMVAERVALMQSRLDEEKRKLNAMQDAAQRAGMHTQVVDP